MEHESFALLIPQRRFSSMNDFPGVDPIRAIDLRWTLRDIKAKRTMFPVDPDHLRTLIDLGLVEMRDDVPAITNAGHQILD
jgi:hypothetical protein